MTSKRPYLLRAMNEWILDNGMTPQILVAAGSTGVEVPSEYIEDGKIVLNISPAAVRDLEINNEMVIFNARFGGRSFPIRIPTRYILAVYAKENGMGIIFQEEETEAEPEADHKLPEKAPHLKIVK